MHKLERNDLTNARESERTALLDDESEDDDFFYRGPNVNPGKLLDKKDSKINQLQGQVKDVVNVMQSNIGKVMERGDRLEELQDKSESLTNSADTFRVKAKGLRRQMWWKECKMRILMSVVVLIVILIITIPIILHFTDKNN